jgi:hypothetical protein
MFYTDAMKAAVQSLYSYCPKGFTINILQNEHFLTVLASEKSFMQLLDTDKRRAIEYMARVKSALEDNGAIVLLVREGGKEE